MYGMGFVSEQIGRPRTWIRGLFAVASCAAFAIACTSTLDFDKTKGGGDGGTSNPTPDGGKSDAGQSGDDDTTQGFCASLDTQPTFCDDFDGDPLGSLWEPEQNTNGSPPPAACGSSRPGSSAGGWPGAPGRPTAA